MPNNECEEVHKSQNGKDGFDFEKEAKLLELL